MSRVPTFQQELAEKAALMELKHERARALREMFQGRQLVLKSKVKEAHDLAKQAKDTATKLKKALSYVHVPDLENPLPNFGMFKGIDLQEVIRFQLPAIPNFDLNLVPNIKLSVIPRFSVNLPRIRVNLGFLRNFDLLPDINLRVLIGYLAVRFPALQLPSIILELEWIFDVNLRGLPDFPTTWFDFEIPQIDIPDVNLPDVNMPRIPNIHLPTINLPTVEIPGLDMPRLWKIPGFDKVLRLLFELFDLCDIEIIIQELGLEAIESFITSALPVVGQLKNGGQAAAEWYRTARDGHRSRKVTRQKEFLLPGNARSAAEAVRKLLKQRAKDHAVTATVKTSQFGVGVAGLFADLGAATGPAVAAAGSVATMCYKIYRLAGEYKVRNALNHYLRATNGELLTAEIFTYCPLMGAFFLANSTTSTVLNFLAEDITRDDFMDDIEHNKKHYIDPLLKQATSFIVSSRWTLLPPIAQNKGSFNEPGRIDKWKKKFKDWAKAKVK